MTSSSDLSFADIGVDNQMERCYTCGKLPRGGDCLHHGKCKDSTPPPPSILRRPSHPPNNNDFFTANAGRRPSYTMAPDGRYRLIRPTVYEDPGNPFDTTTTTTTSPTTPTPRVPPPLPPLPTTLPPVQPQYSPSAYSPQTPGRGYNPLRRLSGSRRRASLRKSISAPLEAGEGALGSVYQNSFGTDEGAGMGGGRSRRGSEYIPARAGWSAGGSGRRASVGVALGAGERERRDTGFYGFWDEVLGEEGRRETVYEEMMRRKIFF